MAPAPVVYDACVLYPAALRDLLLRVAVAGLCRACWSEQILDEAFGALRSARPDLDPERLSRTRRRMCAAVPGCLVSISDQRSVTTPVLPDPGDRHVLATAIACEAKAIITFNVKDFPVATLRQFGIRALSPDNFLAGLIKLSPHRVAEMVERQAAALKNPPCSIEDLLTRLAGQGLERSVAELREQLPS